MSMDRVLTLAEAAKILNLSPVTLRKKAREGSIKAVQIQRGDRTIWGIKESTLKGGKEAVNIEKDFNKILNGWQKAQRVGLIDGRIYSEKTIETNLYGLTRFFKKIGFEPCVEKINKQHFEKYIESIHLDENIKGCGFSVKEITKKALLCFLKYTESRNLTATEQREEIKSIKIKSFTPKRKTKLSKNQVEKFFSVIKHIHPIGSYDYYLTYFPIFLILQTGLRKAELLALKMDDVNLDDGYLIVMAGKGNKRRRIGLSHTAVEAIKNWIGIRANGDYLITLKNGKGMTDESFKRRFKTVQTRSGLDITPHGLRRTFATFSSLSGIQLELVSKTLGHTDLKTTQSYLMADEEDAIAAFRGIGGGVDNSELDNPLTMAERLGLI